MQAPEPIQHYHRRNHITVIMEILVSEDAVFDTKMELMKCSFLNRYDGCSETRSESLADGRRRVCPSCILAAPLFDGQLRDAAADTTCIVYDD